MVMDGFSERIQEFLILSQNRVCGEQATMTPKKQMVTLYLAGLLPPNPEETLVIWIGTCLSV